MAEHFHFNEPVGRSYDGIRKDGQERAGALPGDLRTEDFVRDCYHQGWRALEVRIGIYGEVIGRIWKQGRHRRWSADR